MLEAKFGDDPLVQPINDQCSQHIKTSHSSAD